ncbi:MAG: MEDS domain-containing protein [Bacillota bacterium]|nr:MEDS domain-containing protein [Bacillota bacterium]
MNKLLPLNSSLKLNPGSHILYFYNTLKEYIENASSYILDGLNLGQHVVFIDSTDRYQMILDNLGPIDMTNVYYVSNYEFYEMYHDFHFERVLMNLKNIIDPYVQLNQMVRMWGHVDWVNSDDMINKLHLYECNCDITVAGLGYTTICAYSGETVPSNILLEMMKSHEYLMTDEMITRSTLYKTSNKNNPTAFPSLSVQTSIDSEMDLYKQKLDFVHVVSHEVRNPLTVIKAYATLLEEDELDEKRKLRLKDIKNYAMVIDNEISHIINTEQMLSTDALWKKKWVLASPAIKEVVEIMTIKAQTQNILLKTDMNLKGNEMLLSNLMGFKMIISNLISNAIKYSYEENSIYLSVSVKDELLMIEVSDLGIGMSEEQQRKLFIKYEKINQEQSGQGIGLFMVKKLVDHFQGTIEVRSQLGKGTTFCVKLPIHL